MRTVLITATLTAVAAAIPASAADYYGDIRPVIERKCVMCHQDSSVSFSFEDPEQTYNFRQAIAGAVGTRRMPPWLAAPGHQDYRDDISLTEAELRAFEEWAQGGFEKGAARDREPAQPAYAPFSADLVLDVMPGQSYLPNAERVDDYRCFVVDWPVAEDGYITGFRALPGNLRVAHHLVVFAARAEVAGRFRELDADEAGMGYQCFGGPVPDRFDNDGEREAYEKRHPDGIRQLNSNSFWVAQWAPGTDGYPFPPDTGIPMHPGMVLIVQMHYYSGFAAGERDSGTQMEFTLTEDVEKPALILPLSRSEWLYGQHNQSMVIPPGERRTYSSWMDLDQVGKLAAAMTDTSADRIDAMEVHSANLHMHSYGSSGVISLTDQTGLEETLLSVPRWDLNWQRNFTFRKPKVFERDEFANTQLRVQCTFENPKREPVYGGFGSDEEMCFNFSYIALVLDQDDGEKSSVSGAGGR